MQRRKRVIMVNEIQPAPQEPKEQPTDSGTMISNANMENPVPEGYIPNTTPGEVYVEHHLHLPAERTQS